MWEQTDRFENAQISASSPVLSFLNSFPISPFLTVRFQTVIIYSSSFQMDMSLFVADC